MTILMCSLARRLADITPRGSWWRLALVTLLIGAAVPAFAADPAPPPPSPVAQELIGAFSDAGIHARQNAAIIAIIKENEELRKKVTYYEAWVKGDVDKSSTSK